MDEFQGLRRPKTTAYYSVCEDFRASVTKKLAIMPLLQLLFQFCQYPNTIGNAINLTDGHCKFGIALFKDKAFWL